MSPSDEIIATLCSQQWTDDEAIQQFRAVHEQSPAIDVALLNHVRSDSPEWTRRALNVLSRVESSQRLAPALLPLLSSHDSYIRSQSALLLARARPNTAWVESMLQHPEARVRANVIEGLRGRCSNLPLIHLALEDPASRVRGNAFLLLYDVCAEEALAGLQQMLTSPVSQSRSSGCWACGATEDAAAVDMVKPLRSDEDANVRWNALRALATLHRALRDK